MMRGRAAKAAVVPRWIPLSTPATAIFLLLFFAMIPPRIKAIILQDGSCALNVLLPFSVPLDRTGVLPPVSTGLFTRSIQYSMGHNHMSAAMMAMEDFNARNGRVTPELNDMDIMNDCPIQFDLNNTMFLDTGAIGHLGNRLVVELSRQRPNQPICAFAGPYFDRPAQHIATVAAAAGMPHLPHRAYNIRLSMASESPMTTNLGVDIIGIGQAAVAYLKRTQRDNYISYLHPITDFGVQAAQSMGVMFQRYSIANWQLFGYMSPFFLNTELERDIAVQMKRVKERGYRTILVTLDAYIAELPELANAAEEQGMLDGDYVWIFMPSLEAVAIHNLVRLAESLPDLPSYENVVKFLRGAALIHEVEGHQYLGMDDPFLQAWRNQSADFVERVNRAHLLNSIQGIEKGPSLPPKYFQTYDPEIGAGRLYDIIMAIGMGACRAPRQAADTVMIDGTTHRDAIRTLEFTGATGNVSFGDPAASFGDLGQVRRPVTNVYGIYNLYPPSADPTIIPDTDKYSSFEDAFVLTQVLTGLMGPYEPNSGNWTQVGPVFRYADGRTEPPALLRDIPEQNYLPQRLRIVGFTFMSILLLICAMSVVFVVTHQNHRIVRASQPGFLCMVLLGAAVCSMAIFTVSWDESYGWDEEALSHACMATPWLFCLGHILTYSALGSKLWRVNKVLQFTRRKISATAVIGPMVVLVAATIVVLAAWTIHDPLNWQRVVVDAYTGESIGQCDSDSMNVYIPLLIVVMLIPTLLTCFYAWQTKDVDGVFTESSWIFILIIVQIQVIMVSIPLVVILRGISTEGRYMGLMLLIWTFPASTVMFIMFPKYVAYFETERRSVTSRTSGSVVSRSARGASQGVQISGVSGVSGVSRASKISSEMESAFLGDRSLKADRERDKIVRFSGVSEVSVSSGRPTTTTSIIEETKNEVEIEKVNEALAHKVEEKSLDAELVGLLQHGEHKVIEEQPDGNPESDRLECAPAGGAADADKKDEASPETDMTTNGEIRDSPRDDVIESAPGEAEGESSQERDAPSPEVGVDETGGPRESPGTNTAEEGINSVGSQGDVDDGENENNNSSNVEQIQESSGVPPRATDENVD